MNINSFNVWLKSDHRSTLIMGILNVTPDSFSDGCKFNNVEEAIACGIKMEKEGADIIDIGGESTRPGAKPVVLNEELNRVIPVIKGIRKKSDIAISIDTYKADVANEALLAGANIINDISGLRFDNNMINIVKKSNVPVVIMHMLGTPQDMQINPSYRDLMKELINYFKERIAVIISNGISKDNIIVDPGIGFGKLIEHNFTIIRELKQLVELGFPVLIGPSRKSFIGTTLNLPSNERVEGTAAAVTAAIMNGAQIVRIHDIKEMTRVVTITDKICGISSIL